MVDIGNFTSASFENFDIDLVQKEVGGGTVSTGQIFTVAEVDITK